MSRFTVVAAALLLAACSSPGDGRFVGVNQCAPDGSVVFWEYPNSQGTYRGIEVNKENCG